jgi:hypothetical protein
MVSVLLLISAGLFIRSLRNLRLLDLGLKTDNLIAFNLAPTLSGYTPLRTKQFDKQVLDRVSALPGVTGDGVRADGLLEGNEWDSSMSVEGYEAKPGERHEPVLQRRQPRLLQDDGDSADRRARLRRSRRALRAADPKAQLPSYKVAIVNESYAKHYFGDAQPDRPAHRLRHQPGHEDADRDHRRRQGLEVHRRARRDPAQVFFAFMENDTSAAR